MLFQGTRETYNPQIHTEELSLTSQMNKDFAVHNKVISRFERYCKFTSFLFHTGRVDGGLRAADKRVMKAGASKEIHDNAYRVKFRSINIKPAYSMNAVQLGSFFSGNDMTAVAGVTYTNGVDASSVKHDVIGSVAIKHDPANDIYGDKFNPQDSFRINDGLGSHFWILKSRRASTDDHFILDVKVISPADKFDEDGFEEDQVFMEGGNYYGEGSMKGYQRYDQSYWKIFYSFISRYSLTFTGNALDQREVVWASPSSQSNGMKGKNGDGYWQYKQEWLADEYFGIALELACRYSTSTMDVSTHAWFENSGKNLLSMANMNPEAGVTPPRISDGWITSIQDTIDLSYNVNGGVGGFSASLLEGVCDILTSNSPAGASDNTFVVLGDSIAHTNWDREMKKLVGWNVGNGGTTGAIGGGHNTNIVQSVTSGDSIKLGFTVTEYTYKNNRFVFMLDELFSHPGLNNRSGGLVGNGNMYVLNVTMHEGVSNFELFTRGSGRFFKKKYVNGMHSLNAAADDSMFASTGFDGAFVHYLAELFPICYVEDTCCIIRGEGKYNGGALSGNAGLSNFPTIR